MSEVHPRRARALAGTQMIETNAIQHVSVMVVQGYLNMEQACAYLNCSRSKMYAMIKEGKVKAGVLGSQEYRFRIADLDKVIQFV